MDKDQNDPHDGSGFYRPDDSSPQAPVPAVPPAETPRIVDFAWRANLEACIDAMRSEGGGQYFD